MALSFIVAAGVNSMFVLQTRDKVKSIAILKPVVILKQAICRMRVYSTIPYARVFVPVKEIVSRIERSKERRAVYIARHVVPVNRLAGKVAVVKRRRSVSWQVSRLRVPRHFVEDCIQVIWPHYIIRVKQNYPVARSSLDSFFLVPVAVEVLRVARQEHIRIASEVSEQLFPAAIGAGVVRDNNLSNPRVVFDLSDGFEEKVEAIESG